MKISAIPARALAPEHVAAWGSLQRADRVVDSPFFRPEFTQAVARELDNVEVGVIEDGGSWVGFFPYYRSSDNVGRPLPLSEFQGLILTAGVTLDAHELIRHCRLSAWHFDQVIAAQGVFQPFHWVADASPYIDTSNGFDAYRVQRCRGGSETLPKTLRKLRKLEREVGEVRFEMATQDPRVLQTLIAWKTGQYQRAGLFNMFSRDWTNRLFTSLLDKTDTAFRGNLSALYVNDELQAAIYSLRSHHVLHTWVSAYGPKLAKYSPGYQLLVKVIQASHDLGIERIDLSKGQHERYKQNFKSGAIRLTAGSVDSRASRFVRYAWRRVHYRVRQSPLRDVLTVPWRWIQRAVRQAQFP